jgi:hypothetical protein
MLPSPSLPGLTLRYAHIFTAIVLTTKSTPEIPVFNARIAYYFPALSTSMVI